MNNFFGLEWRRFVYRSYEESLYNFGTNRRLQPKIFNLRHDESDLPCSGCLSFDVELLFFVVDFPLNLVISFRNSVQISEDREMCKVPFGR